MICIRENYYSHLFLKIKIKKNVYRSTSFSVSFLQELNPLIILDVNFSFPVHSPAVWRAIQIIFPWMFSSWLNLLAADYLPRRHCKQTICTLLYTYLHLRNSLVYLYLYIYINFHSAGTKHFQQAVASANNMPPLLAFQDTFLGEWLEASSSFVYHWCSNEKN